MQTHSSIEKFYRIRYVTRMQIFKTLSPRSPTRQCHFVWLLSTEHILKLLPYVVDIEYANLHQCFYDSWLCWSKVPRFTVYLLLYGSWCCSCVELNRLSLFLVVLFVIKSSQQKKKSRKQSIGTYPISHISYSLAWWYLTTTCFIRTEY